MNPYYSFDDEDTRRYRYLYSDAGGNAIFSGDRVVRFLDGTCYSADALETADTQEALEAMGGVISIAEADFTDPLGKEVVEGDDVVEMDDVLYALFPLLGMSVWEIARLLDVSYVEM